ncbi:MAG: flagellar assembly protein FliH [Neomegalonema sp.]|nr:flagellar assembly protein FliH [Neomegalonema sp.]
MTTFSQTAPRRPTLERFLIDEAKEKGAAEERVDPRIEAARMDGFVEGRRVGAEEGRLAEREGLKAEIDQAVAEALAAQAASAGDTAAMALTSALTAWEQERAAIVERIEQGAGRALVAAISAVAPKIAAAGLAAEVANTIAERLSRAVGAGRGQVFAAPSAVETLRAALHERLGAGAPWEVLEDPELGPGAARAEWGEGLASFDLTQTAEEITAAAVAAFCPPEGSAQSKTESEQ